MASEQEWREMLTETLGQRITRQDVRLAVRVDADPDYPIEEFDAGEFADWAADWVDFTLAATAGPVMPGTSETEWITGERDEVRITLLLAKSG